MGGGAPGSTAGMKHDAFLDPDWGSPGIPGLKPFKATMPKGRLFAGAERARQDSPRLPCRVFSDSHDFAPSLTSVFFD